MNGGSAERLLAVCNNSAAVFSAISIVCLTVVWQHWSWTLNVCINIDCGCILYGVNTFSTFMGGDVKLCHFGVYGLAPALLFGLVFGLYHGYRCCIGRSYDHPRTATITTASASETLRGGANRLTHSRRSSFDEQVIVVQPKSRIPYKQWAPAGFLAVLLICLSLAHAVVLTDGYYKTCEQYKRNLIELLGSSGREIAVIHGRLSCGAILDFMDFLHPDTNNWRRDSEINSGLALQLAIASSWLNVIMWFAICVINGVMARKRLRTMGEKTLCCCC